MNINNISCPFCHRNIELELNVGIKVTELKYKCNSCSWKGESNEARIEYYSNDCVTSSTLLCPNCGDFICIDFKAMGGIV